MLLIVATFIFHRNDCIIAISVNPIFPNVVNVGTRIVCPVTASGLLYYVSLCWIERRKGELGLAATHATPLTVHIHLALHCCWPGSHQPSLEYSNKDLLNKLSLFCDKIVLR